MLKHVQHDVAGKHNRSQLLRIIIDIQQVNICMYVWVNYNTRLQKLTN